MGLLRRDKEPQHPCFRICEGVGIARDDIISLLRAFEGPRTVERLRRGKLDPDLRSKLDALGASCWWFPLFASLAIESLLSEGGSRVMRLGGEEDLKEHLSRFAAPHLLPWLVRLLALRTVKSFPRDEVDRLTLEVDSLWTRAERLVDGMSGFLSPEISGLGEWRELERTLFRVVSDGGQDSKRRLTLAGHPDPLIGGYDGSRLYASFRSALTFARVINEELVRVERLNRALEELSELVRDYLSPRGLERLRSMTEEELGDLRGRFESALRRISPSRHHDMLGLVEAALEEGRRGRVSRL